MLVGAPSSRMASLNIEYPSTKGLVSLLVMALNPPFPVPKSSTGSGRRDRTVSAILCAPKKVVEMSSAVLQGVGVS